MSSEMSDLIHIALRKKSMPLFRRLDHSIFMELAEELKIAFSSLRMDGRR